MTSVLVYVEKIDGRVTFTVAARVEVAAAVHDGVGGRCSEEPCEDQAEQPTGLQVRIW